VTTGGRLRLGVIGVGAMGARHAENIAHGDPDATLVAVFDAQPAAAQRVAGSLGCDHAASLEELLRRDDVDAVVIVSPPRFHAEHAVAALDARKHVLLEKPMALTLADADRINAAGARVGVRLQVGFMRRYDPAYAAAKGRIAAGDIGVPRLFKGIDRDQDAPIGPFGSVGRASILTDSAIHDFDVARWLMADEVTAVRATIAVIGDRATVPCPNLALVDLRFSRGAVGNVETLHGAKYGYDIRAEVVGTEGTLLIGGHQRTALTFLGVGGGTHDLTGHWLDRFAEAYRLEMRDFVGATLEGRPPAVTGEDGRRALAIALAADAAGEQGGEIAVG
jgi:scyllo-inositol 2-dehydrogenase (NAD+)